MRGTNVTICKTLHFNEGVLALQASGLIVWSKLSVFPVIQTYSLFITGSISVKRQLNFLCKKQFDIY